MYDLKEENGRSSLGPPQCKSVDMQLQQGPVVCLGQLSTDHVFSPLTQIQLPGTPNQIKIK